MWKRRWKSGEAVVERQQRMPAEGDDHGLVLDRHHLRGANRKETLWEGTNPPRLAQAPAMDLPPIPAIVAKVAVWHPRKRLR
jgi:hypothetical protein